MKSSSLNPIRRSSLRGNPDKQRGVLLIITMIMLLIISGVAVLAVKGTSSTDAVANSTRTQTLAMQAAEAALRYAEIGVFNQNLTTAGKPLMVGKPAHLFAISAAPAGGAAPNWAATTTWDGAGSLSTAIALATLDTLGETGTPGTPSGKPGSFNDVYKRDPECMAQFAPNTGNKLAWITCRGFGPEVAVDAAKGIPFGSEVFLQSTVSLPY